MDNLNVEEDSNINPDMQASPFCNNRSENWGATSQLEMKLERADLNMTLVLNQVDNSVTFKETAIEDIVHEDELSIPDQGPQQQGGRSTRKGNHMKSQIEGTIKLSSKLLSQGHKNLMQRNFFKVQNKKQTRKLAHKRAVVQKETSEAGKILALGKDLGLEPIFTDNETLNIIISRIRNQ